jgi:hypothetical protein
VVRLHRVGPQVDRELGLDAQQLAPPERPVVGELLALQQRCDQPRALPGAAIRRERAHLGGGGQRADHIEEGAAHE